MQKQQETPTLHLLSQTSDKILLRQLVAMVNNHYNAICYIVPLL